MVPWALFLNGGVGILGAQTCKATRGTDEAVSVRQGDPSDDVIDGFIA
jgi:hypothetical protein